MSAFPVPSRAGMLPARSETCIAAEKDMSGQSVQYEVSDRIVTITIDNPPVNAVSSPVLKALNAAFDRAEQEAQARCIIFTGAGERAFCAGGDLRAESDFGTPESSRAFRQLGRQTLNRIEHCKLPVISALHGYCIGGGTALGWVCDIRLAADNTVFRAADAYLGMLPSWGMGLTRLPRFVGRNRALDILLLGENFDAQTAFDMGLVTKVVPRADLMQEARRMAARIATASPTAIRATREAVAENLRRGWDDMVQVEETLCEMMFAHPDAIEGPRAFSEKREARYGS